MRRAALAAGMVAGMVWAAGCPRPTPKPRDPIGPVANPNAPPALGPEPPVPDGLVGRAWLEAVHQGLHERWADSFLENARLYLPIDDPLNVPSLVASLEITVAANGTLASVTVAQGSGNDKFDAAAREIVLDAAPFPAPPPELRSDDGNYYLTWPFARDARQDGVAGARLAVREWEASMAVPALIAAGRFADAARRLAKAATAEPAPDAATAAKLVALSREFALHTIDAALADTTAAVQADAVRALGRAKATGAAARLRALLSEQPDSLIERVIFETLGALGDRDAVPLLADAVKQLDGERSAAAATALAQLGQADAAWALLAAHVRAADEKDPKVRAAALQAAAGVGAPEAAARLVEIAKTRSAARAERVAALAALALVARNGGEGASKALGTALADTDAAVRAAAATALARSGLASKGLFYRAAPLLKDKDSRVRAAGVAATAAVNAKDARSEILLLVRKEKDRGVLAACATALAPFPGDDVRATIVRLAAADDPTVRLAALRALASRDEPAARAVVAAFHADESTELRLLAVGAQTDASVLTTALADISLEVRAAAIVSLTRIAGPLAVLPALAELLAVGSMHERVLYADAWLTATAGPP